MTLGNAIGIAGIIVSALLAVFGDRLKAAIVGQQPRRNSRKSWQDAEEAARVCAQTQSSFADAFKTAAVNRAVRVEALAIVLLPVQLIAVGTVLYLGFAVFMGYLFYTSWVGEEDTNWFSLCIAIGYGIAGACVGGITIRREKTNEKIAERIDEAIADADPTVATDPRSLVQDVQSEFDKVQRKQQLKELKARTKLNRYIRKNFELYVARVKLTHLTTKVQKLEAKATTRGAKATEQELSSKSD